MIPTDNHESRRGARVRLVVLHTTEGATDVDDLGRFFQTGTNQASYHAAFDNERIETYVPYSEAAWSILSGNRISDNAAFCCAAVRDRWASFRAMVRRQPPVLVCDRPDYVRGRAASVKWTTDRWMAHPQMLELAAQWIAQRCIARKVPIRRLSLVEVAACARDVNHPGGVIMHRDWTQGVKDGTHTDCGDALPWDWLLARARQLAGGATPPTTPAGGEMAWRLHATLRKSGKPDGTWVPVEDVITLPGPTGGWRGREVAHVVFGWEGGYIQEAWWGPAGQHVVNWDHKTQTGGRYVGPFDPQIWEAPPGSRFLVIRYAAPNGGSVSVETEH